MSMKIGTGEGLVPPRQPALDNVEKSKQAGPAEGLKGPQKAPAPKKPKDDFALDKGVAPSHDPSLGKKAKPQGRPSGLIQISRAMQQANIGSPAAPSPPPVPPKSAKKAAVATENKAPPLPPRPAKKAPPLPPRPGVRSAAAKPHQQFIDGLKQRAKTQEAKRAEPGQTDAPAKQPQGAFDKLQNLTAGPIEAIQDFAKQDLQAVEDSSGLKRTWQKKVGGQKQAQLKRDQHFQLGDVATVDAQHKVEAGAQAQGQGDVKLGLAGAQAHGEAKGGAQVGAHSAGQLRTDMGQADYAADAQLGAKAKAKGQASLDAQGLQARGELGAEAKAEAKAQAHLHNDLGDAHVGAQAQTKVYAKGQGQVSADATGLRGDVHGKIGAEAEAAVHGDFRSTGVTLGGERLDVNGRAQAYVKAGATAQGRLKADATISPPRAGAEIGGKAFAGAKAGVKGELGLGDMFKVKGHADAWAGAGAEGIAKLGFDDGKLRIAFGAGTALGYGAGAGGSVEIDVKKIGNLAIAAVTDPEAAAKQVEKIGGDVVKSAKGIEKTASKGAGEIRKAATSIIHKTVGSFSS